MHTKPKCNLKVLNGAAFVLYGIHEMKWNECYIFNIFYIWIKIMLKQKLFQ